jgi:hypothetical protein
VLNALQQSLAAHILKASLVSFYDYLVTQEVMASFLQSFKDGKCFFFIDRERTCFGPPNFCYRKLMAGLVA